MDRSFHDQKYLAPHSFQHQQYYSPQLVVTSQVVHAKDEYEAANWMLSAPVTLRRSSSADIPIPQFMIPSSVNQLMNKRYALTADGSRSG